MPSPTLRALPTVALLLLLAGCGDDAIRPTSADSPWRQHVIDDVFFGADGVRVADANGDGLPDVTTGWEDSGVTRAYLHPGYESVEEHWPAVTVGATPNVEDAVWADLDGDGNQDVVSSCEGKTRAVFLSFAPRRPGDFLAPEAWQSGPVPATAGRQWMYAIPLQIDGRNGVDLVVGGKRGNAVIGWLESPPDPRDLSAWRLHEISPAGWVMSIDTVDMNGDGFDDVLVSDRSASAVRGVRWLENPGPEGAAADHPWTSHPIGAGDRNPSFIAEVPLGGATPRRIVVPAGNRSLALFDRDDDDPDQWKETPLPYPRHIGAPKATAVGDIDLDGELDIVVACTNLRGSQDGIVWLPAAAVAEPGSVAVPEVRSISGRQGEKFDRVELLDLDGDGDLDVLTTEELQELGVIWYENPLR